MAFLTFNPVDGQFYNRIVIEFYFIKCQLFIGARYVTNVTYSYVLFNVNGFAWSMNDTLPRDYHLKRYVLKVCTNCALCYSFCWPLYLLFGSRFIWHIEG